MKIALYSDIHLEFHEWEPPIPNVDLVILAGDIGLGTKGLDWAQYKFPYNQVVYVAGNHEYYGYDYTGLLHKMVFPQVKRDNVHFLENDARIIGDVRVLGCTLWSDFKLYGNPVMAKIYSQQGIVDYRKIKMYRELFTPEQSAELHRQSVKFLHQELREPFDGKTVVVTHFVPHKDCVHPMHQGSPVTPYFVSDMSEIFENYKIDLWCFGHSHTNHDFTIENGCRFISNQRGYPGEDNGFNPDLIIEI